MRTVGHGSLQGCTQTAGLATERSANDATQDNLAVAKLACHNTICSVDKEVFLVTYVCSLLAAMGSRHRQGEACARRGRGHALQCYRLPQALLCIPLSKRSAPLHKAVAIVAFCQAQCTTNDCFDRGLQGFRRGPFVSHIPRNSAPAVAAPAAWEKPKPCT